MSMISISSIKLLVWPLILFPAMGRKSLILLKCTCSISLMLHISNFYILSNKILRNILFSVWFWSTNGEAVWFWSTNGGAVHFRATNGEAVCFWSTKGGRDGELFALAPEPKDLQRETRAKGAVWQALKGPARRFIISQFSLLLYSNI